MGVSHTKMRRGEGAKGGKGKEGEQTRPPIRRFEFSEPSNRGEKKERKKGTMEGLKGNEGMKRERKSERKIYATEKIAED